MRMSVAIGVVTGLLAFGRSAPCAETPFEATVDHAESNGKAQNRAFDRKPGEYFRITIRNTCDSFELERETIAKPPTKEPDRSGKVEPSWQAALAGLYAEGERPTCVLRSGKSFEQTVSGGEAGFVFRWRHTEPGKPQIAVRFLGSELKRLNEICGRKDNPLVRESEIEPAVARLEAGGGFEPVLEKLIECGRDAAEGDPARAAVMASLRSYPLRDLTIVAMLAPVPPVAIEFAGAFTGSLLTDKVYALKPVDGAEAPRWKITTDEAARDDARLGVAGMIHVFFPRSTWIGGREVVPTFGLGVGSGGQVDYFVGLSARAYGQFFVSAGLHLGQVSRLPNGLTAVDEVTDANALSNLPKQTKGALFFALSYAFLNPGQDVYTRPFRNADPKEVKP